VFPVQSVVLTTLAVVLLDFPGGMNLSDAPARLCCEEYDQLSRRRFLQAAGTGAAGAALIGTLPAWMPRVAYAGGPPTDGRDVIISINLRGGIDGLSACVPFNDPVYTSAQARPNLRVYAPDDTTRPPGQRAIALANARVSAGARTFDFGLHPALSALLPAYQAGKLLLIHAAGLADTNKSHFDAQRWLENGQPSSANLFTGWLGRHLASSPPVNPASALRAIGVSDGLQRILAGSPLALAISNFQNNPGPVPALLNMAAVTAVLPTGYGLTGTSATSDARLSLLGTMYAGSPEPLGTTAFNTLNTIGRLNRIASTGYQPAGNAAYPASALGYALRSTAALLQANEDATVNQFVEAVAIDVGGWDTHVSAFTFNPTAGAFTGSLVTNLTNLAQSLNAFFQDVIAARARRVTVVVLSEFGRRVGENGTVGTEHGYGNVAMVMGSSVLGGRLLTTWPGLASDQPPDATDVPVTTDLRNLLAEIVAKRLGNSASLNAIFPQFTPSFLNICQ